MNYLKSRIKLLFNPHLSISEKLNLCFRCGVTANEYMKHIVLQHIVRRNGKNFITFNNKFFYLPDDSTDNFKDGIAQVIGENFIFTEEFPLSGMLKPGDTYLDLGANIGTTVVYAYDQVGPKGKVIAVEPLINDILELNLNENNTTGVTIIPKCVSSEPGVLNMSVSDATVDSRIILNDNEPPGIQLKQMAVTTIDDIVNDLKLDSLDLIKMDIEGAEESAILGASETIERFHPRWSIASYHTDLVGDLQHPKLLTLLKESGYKLEEDPDRHIYAF